MFMSAPLLRLKPVATRPGWKQLAVTPLPSTRRAVRFEHVRLGAARCADACDGSGRLRVAARDDRKLRAAAGELLGSREADAVRRPRYDDALAGDAHAEAARSARASGSGVRLRSSSSRKRSNAGGSTRLSPSDSSGSSAVKPGPSVASSNSTPLG